MKFAIVYHANCIDGLASMSIASLALMLRNVPAENVQLVPGYYQHRGDFEFARGREVYILDFSYSVEDMETIIDIASSVTLIDHHEQALRSIQPFIGLLSGVKASGRKRWFSMDACGTHCSGAMLTWNHFFPGKPAPLPVQHVSDRDTWKFEMERTRDFHNYLATLPNDPVDFAIQFKALCALPDLSEEYAKGAVVQKRFMMDLDSVMRQVYHVIMDKVSDDPIPVLNASGMFASEAGNMMSAASPAKVAIVWTLQKDGLKLMLRSTEDGPDVAKIAKQFWGGGGHKNAAGALIKDPDVIQELLTNFIRF